MIDNIQNIAKKLVVDGKGILAADESTATIKKRFDQIDTESNAETRRDYREMLFSTKEAMEKNISGVILYDETIKLCTVETEGATRILVAARSDMY